MIILWLLPFFWNSLSQGSLSYREQAIEEAMENIPVKSIGLGKLEPERMLAPPPIHLNGPIPSDGRKQIQVVWIEGKKFTLTFDPNSNRLEVHDDKEPEYPIIIEAPGHKYWIKFKKGEKWFNRQDIENTPGISDLLAGLIETIMSKEPPPPPDKPGGNGNGDSGDDFGPLPPFKIGTDVVSLEHPEWGLGKVLEVRVFSSHDHQMKNFWGARVRFSEAYGQAIVHFAPCSKFKKVYILPLLKKHDTVMYKMHPEWGPGKVISVGWYDWYWRVTAQFWAEGQIKEVSANEAEFEKKIQ